MAWLKAAAESFVIKVKANRAGGPCCHSDFEIKAEQDSLIRNYPNLAALIVAVELLKCRSSESTITGAISGKFSLKFEVINSMLINVREAKWRPPKLRKPDMLSLVM